MGENAFPCYVSGSMLTHDRGEGIVKRVHRLLIPPGKVRHE